MNNDISSNSNSNLPMNAYTGTPETWLPNDDKTIRYRLLHESAHYPGADLEDRRIQPVIYAHEVKNVVNAG